AVGQGAGLAGGVLPEQGGPVAAAALDLAARQSDAEVVVRGDEAPRVPGAAEGFVVEGHGVFLRPQPTSARPAEKAAAGRVGFQETRCPARSDGKSGPDAAAPSWHGLSLPCARWHELTRTVMVAGRPRSGRGEWAARSRTRAAYDKSVG